MEWCVLPLEGSLAAICCWVIGNVPRTFNKCNGETGTHTTVLSVLFIYKCCNAKSAGSTVWGHFFYLPETWAVKVVWVGDAVTVLIFRDRLCQMRSLIHMSLQRRYLKLLHIKGAICKNWQSVKVILKTNRQNQRDITVTTLTSGKKNWNSIYYLRQLNGI